ncbi:MAG: Ldh family oxidoreductase [Pseudomonadota bacterium]
MPRLTLDEIETLCFDALRRVGASETQASAAALELRDAEAEGIRNVGLGYIHLYLKHLACGKVRGDAVPRTVRTSASTTVVDAGHGFCHTAYLHGEARLIDCARREGVGVMAINRSYSAGVLGWFVRRLAQQGLVALMYANSSKAVAAHGGKVPFFGTNPLAFSAPRAGEEPVVVDMATASTARVNIVRAAREGEPIEPGHAIDEHGEPTTDAAAALRGAQLPLAGPKGFGLGLMVDILGGVLTGGNASFDAAMFSNNEGGPPNVGQVIIALDPAFFADGFTQRLDNMLSAMTEGNDVRVPGERRGHLRREHTANGIEVPEALLQQIAELSTAS